MPFLPLKLNMPCMFRCAARRAFSKKAGLLVNPATFIAELTFLLFDFVTTEVFLSLYEQNVLAQNWVVFFEAEFVWGVHSIFLGIICTHARFLRDETD